MASTHGWAEVEETRKREIIAAIRSGGATAGPAHAELDLTDRCNVACYFCNQQDVRTKLQVPLETVRTLLDELVGGGLRSVRLSGGGDPLAYRGIATVLDWLHETGVVVDNLTTNGALLGPDLIAKLVAPGRCREVLVSLNAADAADYARMMQVKPETYGKVLGNVAALVAARGEAAQPVLTIQFLLDRGNYHRLPEMYATAARLGADRVGVNTVLPIPNERIPLERMLGPADFATVAPFLEQVLRADKDAGRLFLCFAFPEWNAACEELNRRLATSLPVVYPQAPEFRDENGSCFFAWYSVTVRGTGELYPCCMLLNPNYRPLGSVAGGEKRSFRGHWQGERFSRLRSEMRDLLLAGGRILYSPRRFRELAPPCVLPGACGLKNMYFRGDGVFYRELADVLAERRRAEIGWRGGWRGVRRLWEITRFRWHHGMRVRARPLLRRMAVRLQRLAVVLARV
jgi:MoaA/NifB/PqqE/SkfB family radical SAM enzyme